MDALLTLDLGNSRLRAARFADARAEPVPCLDLPAPGDAAQARALAGVLESIDRVRAVALASVAAAEPTQALAELCAKHFGAEPLLNPDAGLELDVRSPETVGLDRLYAARGALASGEPAAIVVDAGTALTVDAVCGDSGAAVGIFLGGAIAPGPRILAECLSRAGARLPEFESRPRASALGRDTREALAAGVSVGFRGAARELAREVAREADLIDATLYLTGGAAVYLEELFEESHPRVVHDPFLVLRGLALAASSAS